MNALIIGIEYKDFWSMTPHDINVCFEGYEKKQEYAIDLQNALMYIQGRYFVEALLCTVGNMFSKKGAKTLEYPKEPYDIKPPRELTQEEKDAQVAMIFANLQRMKESFERSKGGNL